SLDRFDRDQPHEPRPGGRRMSRRRRIRAVVALPLAAGLAGLLVWGFSGMPRFGDFHAAYERLLNAVAVPQRHSTNVVTAVVFDYRGFDTMGEEFILFASVVGVVLLLRDQRGPPPTRDVDAVRSEAVRVWG